MSSELFQFYKLWFQKVSLKRVVLWHDSHRSHFCIKMTPLEIDSIFSQIADENDFQDHVTNNFTFYIHFQSRVMGTFKQSIIFDFCKLPYLEIELVVDVGLHELSDQPHQDFKQVKEKAISDSTWNEKNIKVRYPKGFALTRFYTCLPYATTNIHAFVLNEARLFRNSRWRPKTLEEDTKSLKLKEVFWIRMTSEVAKFRQKITLLFLRAWSLNYFDFPPQHPWELWKNITYSIKIFTSTFLYLHLYMYIKCMAIIFNILVDFHVLEGKCKMFIEFILLFQCQRVLGQ